MPNRNPKDFPDALVMFDKTYFFLKDLHEVIKVMTRTARHACKAGVELLPSVDDGVIRLTSLEPERDVMITFRIEKGSYRLLFHFSDSTPEKDFCINLEYDFRSEMWILTSVTDELPMTKKRFCATFGLRTDQKGFHIKRQTRQDSWATIIKILKYAGTLATQED